MDDVWGEDSYLKGKNGVYFQPGRTVSADSSFLFPEAFVFTPPIFRSRTSRVDGGGGERWDTVGGETETSLKKRRSGMDKPQGRKSG